MFNNKYVKGDKMYGRNGRGRSIRLLCFVMILGICINILPSTKMVTYAATKKYIYETLDDIAENLDIFKTICYGTISVKKVGNKYYYQFSRSKYPVVQINVTAFKTTPENINLVKDNQALSKSADSNTARICYYYRMKIDEGKGGGQFDTYTTSMMRFCLEVMGDSANDVDLKCKLLNHVTFSYDTKVYLAGTDPEVIELSRQGKLEKVSGIGNQRYVNMNDKVLVEPFTENSYKKALKRSSDVEAVTPTVAFEITNIGDYKICLSKGNIFGQGNADVESVKIADLVKVGSTIKSMFTATNTLGVLKSLTDLGLAGAKFVSDNKKVSEFKVEEPFIIYDRNRMNPVLKTVITSPINLSNQDDYVNIRLTMTNSIKGDVRKKNPNNAKFKVEFSF